MPEMGSYKTSVLIATASVTTAVTLCGRLGRKAAIRRAWDHLNREERWSRPFLNELRSFC